MFLQVFVCVCVSQVERQRENAAALGAVRFFSPQKQSETSIGNLEMLSKHECGHLEKLSKRQYGMRYQSFKLL